MLVLPGGWPMRSIPPVMRWTTSSGVVDLGGQVPGHDAVAEDDDAVGDRRRPGPWCG